METIKAEVTVENTSEVPGAYMALNDAIFQARMAKFKAIKDRSNDHVSNVVVSKDYTDAQFPSF